MNPDDVDFSILETLDISSRPIINADKIKARVKLDPDELGARLGVLHGGGYVVAQWGSHMPGVSLPNGIYAAQITDKGKMALLKRS